MALAEQVNDLGDALGSDRGPALRTVDVAEEGATVELGERVEERPGVWVLGERSLDVRREVVTLRSLRREEDRHMVTDREAAIASPGWPENDAEPVAHGFDHGSHAHAVHRPVHVVLRLGAPHAVGVEQHRDIDPAADADQRRVIALSSVSRAGHTRRCWQPGPPLARSRIQGPEHQRPDLHERGSVPLGRTRGVPPSSGTYPQPSDLGFHHSG